MNSDVVTEYLSKFKQNLELLIALFESTLNPSSNRSSINEVSDNVEVFDHSLIYCVFSQVINCVFSQVINDRVKRVSNSRINT